MSELAVRILRARVYGECTDNNWAHCRWFWTLPENIAWLETVLAEGRVKL